VETSHSPLFISQEDDKTAAILLRREAEKGFVDTGSCGTAVLFSIATRNGSLQVDKNNLIVSRLFINTI
jgi:hypothetical protein